MQVLKNAAVRNRSNAYLIIDSTLVSPVANDAVVVTNGRIAWVGPENRLPEQFSHHDLTVIDQPNRAVMPELIDGHVHISFGEARSEEELAIYTYERHRVYLAGNYDYDEEAGRGIIHA